MKKLKLVITFLVAQCFAFSAHAADFSFSMGITGHAGLYEASGEEKIGGTNAKGTETAAADFSYPSLFAEVMMGERFVVGAFMVPDAETTTEVEETRLDMKTDGSPTATTVTNKVKAEFADMYTIYAKVYVTDSAYITGGISTMDVNTKESLETGSTYGDAQLDGTEIGFGYDIKTDSGMFIRAEAVLVEYDGVTLTSSANSNTVKLNGIDGAEGRLSLGYTF